jgi:GST-like protein
MIDFYYAPTPNGWKVAILLEELGVEYTTHLMKLGEGDQFKPAFLAISPNAKMPVIVDQETGTSVFESGVILWYLAEKAGRFLPDDPALKLEVMQWLFWQVGNQGPMGGQLSHFVNYAPEGQDYSAKRYRGEYERNLAVLERRLDGQDWIVGEYSIADMLAFPWVFIAKPLTSSLEDFPNVKAWRRRIKERPAVMRAINLHKAKQNRGEQNAQNNKVLYNQSAAHLLDK